MKGLPSGLNPDPLKNNSTNSRDALLESVWGFGMDGDAGDLRETLFNEVFEGREDVVDSGYGIVAFHDAVAGDEDVVVDLAHADIVAIEKLVVIPGHVIEEGFDSKLELAHFTHPDFRCGDVAAERLDVYVDVEFMAGVAQGSDGVFEFGGLAMGLAEREILVHFQMKFDEEIAVLLVSGDIVNGMAHPLGDGANGLKKIFVVWRAGFRVNDNVSGDDLADALLDGVRKRMDALEIGGTRDRDGGVDKMAIAGTPDTHAFHAKYALHMADGIADFVLKPFRRSVEKSVERAATDLRA